MKILENLHAFIWMNQTANNCNTFLIDGEKRILVDPGHTHLFGNVRDGLARLSLTPEDMDVVIVTHAHPDHMEGIKIFSDFPTMIAISAKEMDFIRSVAPHYGDALGLSEFEPDLLLQEGDLKIGNLRFQVLQTPGHSPGSICLYWIDKQVLFTGDVVFNQGIGRTDLPGGSGKELMASIKRLAQMKAGFLLTGHGDIVVGEDQVKTNFDNIEEMWFPYL